ncbi:hypothetical protein HHI36_009818 [Cryptolaemus montrouzieri]|uniref:PHD finger protein 10 n=1 Tax=Cryptolaemus montrouzieri TaxID=559131 RepID=A0ABD2MGW0_9CUCU
MDGEEVGIQSTLTSTMGSVLLSQNNDKNDANDSTPTSSTDASSNYSALSLNATDDPISSTSSDLTEKNKIRGGVLEMKNKNMEVSKSLIGTDGDVDLLDMNITNVSTEPINEDVEDIVQDLENLLGESEPVNDFPSRKKELQNKSEDMVVEFNNDINVKSNSTVMLLDSEFEKSASTKGEKDHLHLNETDTSSEHMAVPKSEEKHVEICKDLNTEVGAEQKFILPKTGAVQDSEEKYTLVCDTGKISSQSECILKEVLCSQVENVVISEKKENSPVESESQEIQTEIEKNSPEVEIQSEVAENCNKTIEVVEESSEANKSGNSMPQLDFEDIEVNSKAELISELSDLKRKESSEVCDEKIVEEDSKESVSVDATAETSKLPSISDKVTLEASEKSTQENPDSNRLVNLEVEEVIESSVLSVENVENTEIVPVGIEEVIKDPIAVIDELLENIETVDTPKTADFIEELIESVVPESIVKSIEPVESSKIACGENSEEINEIAVQELQQVVIDNEEEEATTEEKIPSDENATIFSEETTKPDFQEETECGVEEIKTDPGKLKEPIMEKEEMKELLVDEDNIEKGQLITDESVAVEETKVVNEKTETVINESEHIDEDLPDVVETGPVAHSVQDGETEDGLQEELVPMLDEKTLEKTELGFDEVSKPATEQDLCSVDKKEDICVDKKTDSAVDGEIEFVKQEPEPNVNVKLVATEEELKTDVEKDAKLIADVESDLPAVEEVVDKGTSLPEETESIINEEAKSPSEEVIEAVTEAKTVSSVQETVSVIEVISDSVAGKESEPDTVSDYVEEVPEPVVEENSESFEEPAVVDDTNEVTIEEICEPIEEQKQQPVVEDVQEPVVEDVHEPLVEDDVQESLVEDVQEPLVEDIQEPLTQDVQEPLVEDVQESLVEDVQEPLVEDVQETLVENVQETIVENVEETLVEDVEEPLVEDVQEPLVGDVQEPLMEDVQEPLVEDVQEPLVEDVQEPLVEDVQESVVEDVQEPVVEDVQEPAMEDVQEPVVEDVQEPVVEDAQEPVVEDVQEPVVENVQEPGDKAEEDQEQTDDQDQIVAQEGKCAEIEQGEEISKPKLEETQKVEPMHEEEIVLSTDMKQEEISENSVEVIQNDVKYDTMKQKVDLEEASEVVEKTREDVENLKEEVAASSPSSKEELIPVVEEMIIKKTIVYEHDCAAHKDKDVDCENKNLEDETKEPDSSIEVGVVEHPEDSPSSVEYIESSSSQERLDKDDSNSSLGEMMAIVQKRSLSQLAEANEDPVRSGEGIPDGKSAKKVLEEEKLPSLATSDQATSQKQVEEAVDSITMNNSIQDQTTAAVQSILDNMLAEESNVEIVSDKEEPPVVHSSYSSYELQKAVQQIQDISHIDDVDEEVSYIANTEKSKEPDVKLVQVLEAESTEKDSIEFIAENVVEQKESESSISEQETVESSGIEEIKDVVEDIVTVSEAVEVSDDEESKENQIMPSIKKIQEIPIVEPSLDLSEESSEESSGEDKASNKVTSTVPSFVPSEEDKDTAKQTKKLENTPKKIIPRETRHSSRISERSKEKPSKEDINEPLSINIEEAEKEKNFSPKITIKPIKEDEEDRDEHKGSLKITITKQSDNTHSILKICSPEAENRHKQPENDDQNVVPKLVIKTSDVEQHSPKMSTRSSKQCSSTNANTRSGSPRITIKPILKPEGKETPTSPLKITIKPLGKPEEFSKQQQQKHSPKLSKKMDEDHYGTRSKVLKSSENSDVHSPKVTIKPVVKPIEEEQHPTTPKITIKPIEKPDEGKMSPKITIKPIVRQIEADTEIDDDVKKRIVLKINKGNIPPKDTDKMQKKREHEDDKSEKLAKIKLKFSKGGDAHIVHEASEDRYSPTKRGQDFESEKSKRLRGNPGNDSDEDVKIIEDRQSPIIISEDSRSQDSVILVEEPKKPIVDNSIVEPKVTPIAPIVPVVTGPRKRGRPRKVPLVAREDYGNVQREEASLTPPVGVPGEQAGSETESSGRPKRSCRGQSVRDTLGIKPRKPKTPAKPRGGKRGGGVRNVSMKPEKKSKSKKKYK